MREREEEKEERQKKSIRGRTKTEINRGSKGGRAGRKKEELRGKEK